MDTFTKFVVITPPPRGRPLPTLLQPRFVPSDALLHYKNARPPPPNATHCSFLVIPGHYPPAAMLAVILGYSLNHPLLGGYPSVPSSLQILILSLFRSETSASPEGTDTRHSAHNREFYADFLKPATYKKLKRLQK